VFALFWIDPGELVKIRNLARDLYWQIADVIAGDSLDPTLPIENGAAEGLSPQTVWADHAHAGDDDSFSR
jgi:hypothetical protein